jgi:hypothetical protein
METRTNKLDLSQLAKRIVDEAIGEAETHTESPKAIAVRASGKKGGMARAVSLTPEQRSQIASIAARVRWKKA